jgi:hypothetical protein
MGFLQRRGFGWEIVKRVTREALPTIVEADGVWQDETDEDD